MGGQPGECWRALFFQLGEHNKSQIERSKKGVSEKEVLGQVLELRLMDQEYLYAVFTAHINGIICEL